MLEVKRNPMSGGMPNVKTTFRTMEALDHVDEPKTGLKAVFAYPGTDKGVNTKQFGR